MEVTKQNPDYPACKCGATCSAECTCGVCKSCDGSGFHDAVVYEEGFAVAHTTPECLRCDGTGNEPTPERLTEIDADLAHE